MEHPTPREQLRAWISIGIEFFLLAVLCVIGLVLLL